VPRLHEKNHAICSPPRKKEKKSHETIIEGKEDSICLPCNQRSRHLPPLDRAVAYKKKKRKKKQKTIPQTNCPKLPITLPPLLPHERGKERQATAVTRSASSADWGKERKKKKKKDSVCFSPMRNGGKKEKNTSPTAAHLYDPFGPPARKKEKGIEKAYL